MKIKAPKKIVVSRTDSIGDVALTLPLIGILKEKFAEAKLIFLGNTYTKPIINTIENIDEVWSWSDMQAMGDQEQTSWLKHQNIDVFIHVFPRREIARLVKKANIPHRIGTSHRLFHMLTCNYRVNFTRKNSDLHEAQLNTKLLKPLGISRSFSLGDLNTYFQFSNLSPLDAVFEGFLKTDKKNIVLHPKSKGSALEWGVSNFIDLAKKLDPNKYQVFFTGTEDESSYFRTSLPKQSNVIDLSGKMSLEQLIAFIAKSDILIAASTGPLHIAGLSNIHTIGLFTTRKPLHPGRWRPLGENVEIITENKESERNQLLNIPVQSVLIAINKVT